MKAKFRIVAPAAASAAVAVLLLTGCADKPVRIPGGAFVEEPYTGETETKSHTVLSNGRETVDNEIIFIDDEVPVGPVDSGSQASQGGSAQAQQGSGSAQVQQGGGSQLQPVEEQPAANSNVPEGSVEYKVVKGDTLWGISMVYGVPVARLVEINGLDEKAPLKIGQVIMIPPDAKNAVGKPVQKKTETKAETKTETKATATTTKPATATTTKPVAKDGETLYVVKSGDNLSMIAYRHHVKLADLIAANKVDPNAVLRVGQTLVIPAAGAKAATTTTTKPATAATTTTKTDSASTTKPATATTTTTKTDSASTTKPATATTTTTKGGEGTGGVVEPIGGASMGGSASASTSTPAASASTSASSATAGLAPVSGISDEVFAVPINSEATLEEVARNHDKNLDDLIRLNPEFKPGQKIPAGTAVKMPLF